MRRAVRRRSRGTDQSGELCSDQACCSLSPGLREARMTGAKTRSGKEAAAFKRLVKCYEEKQYKGPLL